MEVWRFALRSKAEKWAINVYSHLKVSALDGKKTLHWWNVKFRRVWSCLHACLEKQHVSFSRDTSVKFESLKCETLFFCQTLFCVTSSSSSIFNRIRTEGQNVLNMQRTHVDLHHFINGNQHFKPLKPIFIGKKSFCKILQISMEISAKKFSIKL